MKRNSLDTKKLGKCLRNSSESLCFVESFLFDQESCAMFIYQPIRAKGFSETLTHNWTFRASQSYLYSSFPLRLTICDEQYSRQGVRDEPNANYRIVTFRKSSFFPFKKCAEVFKQRTAKLFFFKHFSCSLNDAHPFLHLDASALEKRLIAFSFLCVYR